MDRFLKITRIIVLSYFLVMGYLLFLKQMPPYLTFGYGIFDVVFVCLYGVSFAIYLAFSFKPYINESTPFTLKLLVVLGYLLIGITFMHLTMLRGIGV